MIPKKIHQMWLNKEDPIISDKYNDKIDSWKKTGYKYKLWNYENSYELIKNNFNERVLDVFVNSVPTICKCDLARFCIVYVHGGIYCDLNFTCIDVDLEKYFKNKDIVLYKEPEAHYILGGEKLYNGIFASVKKHPFIYGWIEKMTDYLIYNNYGSVQNVFYLTGPVAFLHYYKNYTNPPEISNNCEALSITYTGDVSTECKNNDCPKYAIKHWGKDSNWLEREISKSHLNIFIIIIFFILIIFVLMFIIMKWRY